MMPLNRPSSKIPNLESKLRHYLAYNRSYDSLTFFKFPHRRHYKFFDFSIFRFFKIFSPEEALPCAEPRRMTY